jgi:tripartite-type tricarboxylate transporter receptor subunit TctC
MNHAGRIAAGLTIALGLAIANGATAETQTPLGKTLYLLIGSGEGGGFDGSARLLAQFLPRYLPGNPTIVPQNMPGASGLRVAELLYNVSPRDGSTVAMTQPNLVLNGALDKTAKYKAQEYAWMGRAGSFTTYALVSTKSPVQSVAEAKTNPLILGASGPSGPGAMLPSALNHLIDTKFTIVKGYRSAQETGLAFDRGEIPGIGSASLEFIEHKRWVEDGKAKILFTIGPERSDTFKDAPSAVELMENDRDRKVMKLITVSSVIGRALIAPPGVPADKVALWRDAFDKVMKDPEYLAASERRGFEVEPMRGVDLEHVVNEALSMPDDVIQRAREATKIGF